MIVARMGKRTVRRTLGLVGDMDGGSEMSGARHKVRGVTVAHSLSWTCKIILPSHHHHHLFRRMSTPHELPDLPSLPPLELPAYDVSFLSVPPSDPISSRPLQSPSLSLAESFSTAYTSATSPDDNPESTRLLSSSLAPPYSLRKSISVDSFAQYTRDARAPLAENQLPAYGTSAGTEREPISWSSRSRGQSLSSIQPDHPPSFPLDSDVDRYEPLSVSPTERFRRQSLKSPESPMSPLRGGDLTLPSRTSSTITPNPYERGDFPSVASASSLQSSSKRANAYQHQLPPAGRLRSGSLGYNMPSTKTIMNPHIPSFASPLPYVICQSELMGA